MALLEYLKLDVAARLDPSQVPPEMLAFFEDVRARNAAELRRYRPRSTRRRSRVLNLLPPFGQFQNGQRTKGLLVAGVGMVALVSNIGTYGLLRQWCSKTTGLCMSSGVSREGEARILRTVNLVSGAVLVGTVAYGIIDGFVHSRTAPPKVSVGWMPLQRGAGVMFGTKF